ncbi:hypothetical protein [Rhodopseudomonas sp. P2A-2r]|uniref:hypothetical protein n=1 Tax=unclassified Rhodopseudomonas TaxID=2638247 RepID=UPI002234A9EA|nr:hypothetical protein [Rhodopseudomonas sp. P2A-2r]UZE52412.1 hypothetical protein ONR75_22175 [Rhodopseudomonas sp. P2A-2r]
MAPAPKHHPTPLSGSARSALKKELAQSHGITVMLARQSAELRSQGEALIRRAERPHGVRRRSGSLWRP